MTHKQPPVLSRLAFISIFAGLMPAGPVSGTGVARDFASDGSVEYGRPAPISAVAYEITFDETTAPFRRISVAMSFQVADAEPVVLSLPAWTPGSYELDNYARNVSNFAARSGETALRWDKMDWDTWRVFPDGAGEVTVAFDYRADALDTGSAWTAPDFAFFNGTNLFLYPEGQGYGFSARVTFRTEPDWQVATGLTQAGGKHEYVAEDFHELVDMPTFIGRFDIDGAEIEGVQHRLATYPSGLVTGERREGIWAQIRGMMPPMGAVFDETPFESYTTFMVFPDEFGGASALEHRNSHLGIYTPQLVGSEVLASVVAHEIFHAWNVKRLRPAPLVPYDYGRPQPTTLLWVSEGITSYYDDLSLVRGGVFEPEYFYESTSGDIATTESAGAVALEDASLTAWIGTRDGTGSIYYPKGAVAGFLLDILIRDATDNEASLDDVMRELYWGTYKETFTGFSEDAWWDAVTRTAGGASFDDFYVRYVDGREPYPWDEVLPLAGLTLEKVTSVRPLVGIFAQYDSLGVQVAGLTPGGAAADGGVREGDYLLRAGPVELGTPEDFDAFRAHFSSVPEGTTYEVVVRRGEEEITLDLDLRLSEDEQYTLKEDPNASAKAVRIRESLLSGR